MPQQPACGIGVRTGAETRPIIEDNDCFENPMAGIGAEEEVSPVTRSNRCYKNKLAGIDQESDAVTTLTGNQCHNNGESGIGFAACSAGRSVLTRNTVVDNGKVAVGIHSGWTVTMSDNRLSPTGGMPQS